jgi:hypothetical protein
MSLDWIARIKESRLDGHVLGFACLVVLLTGLLAGVFPALQASEAVFKLLYLALKNIEKKWTMPIREWKQALQQFAIVFEGRMPLP